MIVSEIESKMQKVFANRKDIASRILTAKKELNSVKSAEETAKQDVQEYELKLKTVKNSDPVSIVSFKVIKNSLLDKKAKLVTAQIATASSKQKLNQLEKIGQGLEAEYRQLEQNLSKFGNNVLELENHAKP